MQSIKHPMLATLLLLVALMAQGRPAIAGACDKESFEAAEFIVCTVKPGYGDLQLFWKNENGEPYRYFSAVAEAAARSGRTLAFALNAGMYTTDFAPVGLYVENGRQLQPLNTKTVEGTPGNIPNFYKKPNGVFFAEETKVSIVSTEAYQKLAPKVRFATQSGPMLVSGNEVNPIFIVGSTDKTRRSGVGVCEDGAVRFAISEDAVNFYDFARLFRDHLSCPDALFLDGGHGVGLYDPGMDRNDMSWHGGFGPILGVVE